MRTLDAQGYPLRMMASQFSQRSEDIRVIRMQFANRVQQISQGHDGWTGLGARAYIVQAEVLIGKVDVAIHAFQLASNTLFQLADRVDAIHAMKHRVEQLRNQLISHLQLYQTHAFQSTTHGDPSISQLESEIRYLENQIEADSLKYDQEATDQLHHITNMAPHVHSLLQEMEAATLFIGPTLDPGLVPILVKPEIGARTGRDKVDYLNEVILMNRSVYQYYEMHPEAKGPHGESAAEMLALATKLQNEAQRDGGTIGVPIVFMHGLEGGKGTFEKMVAESGGYSKIYTFKKDGTVVTEDGPNQDADQPLIQFVFEDGAMHYQNQVDAFSSLVGRVKKDNDCSYFMVAAHSMGGVITTKYIEDTGGDDILRFATLGSPILGSDDDAVAHKVIEAAPPLDPFTDLLKLGVAALDWFKPAIPELEAGSKANREIYDNRGKFNQNIDVFSGGGDGWGKLGDQVVMPKSAFGLKFFANPEKFHSKLYPNDTHGQLHEGEEEIQDTMKFLKFGEIPHVKK